MLKPERHKYILDRIEDEGRVLVTTLTKELDLTEDTIRKDLQELARLGLVLRVHGGALKLEQESAPIGSFKQKWAFSKVELAQKAISLLQDKKVVYLDNCSANLSFSKFIPSAYAGTIITNSPAIAISLCTYQNVSIHLLPGEMAREAQEVMGATTLKAIEELNIELCLLDVVSLDAERGLTTSSHEKATLQKQLIKQSLQKAAIIPKDKIDTVSAFHVGRIDDLDIMITENGLSEERLRPYQDLGIEIQQA